jgi:hypothetical protein
MIAAHPAIMNAAFAAIQLALGVALVSRRYARVALIASAVWAMSVWIVGEGLGGVASGGTIFMGAPGAALLYAVIAGLALPTRGANADQRPSWLAVPAWSALWLTATILQFVAGNDSSSSLTMMFRAATGSVPSWIATTDGTIGRASLPTWTAAAIIALTLMIALWSFVPGLCQRLSVGAGLIISLAGWSLIQGFGDLTSGQATDPNIGPLVVLLAVGVLAASPRPSATEVIIGAHVVPRRRLAQRVTVAANR